MASSSVGDKQLHRIIRDLRDAVLELSKEHKECGEPITDDSTNLHKFFYKLEYLLQFDQKEKTTFLGQRKDYWDYFCDCLIKMKGANDGIRFVKSIPELKTSLGKGRAFIRYSLVHQRLADTLQQCLINQKVTCDWYYARSPFLKSHLTSDIINHLYELNQIQFDVAARGYDLDADWPMFARRTLGSGTASQWRPPSRCSSINSLISNYSQVPEFMPIPNVGQNLLGELEEAGESSPCNIAENLRIELDQSEIRQQELQLKIQELSKEAAELKDVVKDLQGQLLAAQRTSSAPKINTEAGNQDRATDLPSTTEALNGELQEKLAASENKNMELLTKFDEALKEKAQQTTKYCDSAWKIQELIDKLKIAEEERLEAKREADERARHCERLSEELKNREEELRNAEDKLVEVRAGAQDEREEALRRLEELHGAVGRIQGALTLKEKETGNLRAQLQDLQASLECREKQAEELRRRLQEERREEIKQRCGMSTSQSDAGEGDLQDLRELLRNKEEEQAISEDKLKLLEERVEKLDAEKQDLSSKLADSKAVSADFCKKLEDCEAHCNSLMQTNTKLLQMMKARGEDIAEIAESKVVPRDQPTSRKAPEWLSDGPAEAAAQPAQHQEHTEVIQEAFVQNELSVPHFKRVELENMNLCEVQSSLKQQLAKVQVELDSHTAKVAELEEKLAISQTCQSDLQKKLQETEEKLRDQTLQCGLLRAQTQELESRTVALHVEKEAAECNEKPHPSRSTDAEETPFKLVVAEAQLEFNLKELDRLREEVVELRIQLSARTEERLKAQVLQEVTEASREDLRLLAEQRTYQVEELNRRHVDEILQSREREEALIRERDAEAQARAALAAEVTASREELHKLKLRYDALCVENGESKEALHRANTETAELGVHVCMLTAENEEARLRWEGLATRMQELEQEALHGADQQIERLRQENLQLHDKLHQEDLQRTSDSTSSDQEEIKALRFQLSTQAMSHTKQIQTVNEELQEVRAQLGTEKEKVSTLENTLRELEAANQNHCQHMEGKSVQMAEFERLIQKKEDEIKQLKGDLSRSEESLAVAEQTCQGLSESLQRVTKDKQSVDLRTAAEIDDLYRTKVNLEERLVELIREKDELWQKTDALQFERKLRNEESEKDVNYCLGCRNQFSWWLRKHTCRLCGRPFCYNCCNNTVSTQQGGSRVHCCRDCYDHHTAVVERHPAEEAASSTPIALLSRLHPIRAIANFTGAEETEKQDDGLFDIITDEELSSTNDGDSFATACSPGQEQQGAAQLPSASDSFSEDAESFSASAQDAEICLLKSGELTLSIPFTLDDISEFGESSRELFIKSSSYSSLPIAVGTAGPTVTWTFTSEPKSISFSVTYRESAETPLEQAKVLIPLTRCNSHKETIKGELKVRNPGEYTLIFDNSFSRFISKKVLYHLNVEKPVVYDGSDCL